MILTTNTFTIGTDGVYIIRATGATLSGVESLEPPYPLAASHPDGPVAESWGPLTDDSDAAIPVTDGAKTVLRLGEGMVIRANPAPAGGTYLEIFKAGS